MAKPALHVIAPFHGFLTDEWSSCAFSQKARKMSAMMEPLGYTVYEYANDPSESVCSNKVPLLTLEEMQSYAGDRQTGAFHGNTAIIGSPHWREFDLRMRVALKKRVQPRDIILHTFGRSHWNLKNQGFEGIAACESGIGYPDAPFGAFRVFESATWQSWHAGKHGEAPSDYSWICPNSFDVEEWTLGDGSGDYSLFMGRVYEGKGMSIIKALAEAGEKIVVAGQGDITPYAHPNIKYVGVVTGKARNTLVGNARCMLMPTRFSEPFGGSGVEAQICGTPLIASDFAAFTETIEHGYTGFRCHTLGDWIEAIRRSKKLDRAYISLHAENLYSLETVALQYGKIFTQISDLWADGWYTKRPIFV